MPRGGRRSGKVGQAYSNRSDLQGASLHSKTYGDGAARAASTAAVPVAAPPTSSVPGAQSAAPAAPAGPAPGTLGGLTDPTARPDEPFTAGMPFGAGPGPEALSHPDPDAAAIGRLRALYAQSGSPALGRLLEAWDE